MCGRYVAGDMTWQQYHDWLTGKASPPPPEDSTRRHWNIPPTALEPIVLREAGERALVLARWGLVPHWWRKPLSELRAASFNARAEEAAAKPFFRDAYRHAHCLVPAQGYYEWHGPKRAKRPFYISVETNEPGFCFAGLWSRVSLADFSGWTFAILTRPAMAPIAHIHPRMPVILSATAYDDWLAGAPLVEVDQIDGARLKAHEISKAVGSVQAEGPELIEPIED